MSSPKSMAHRRSKMPRPLDYDFVRYLAAKKTVDDRALNRQVWDCLRRVLPEARPRGALRVLEVGAGIGSMVERMAQDPLFAGACWTAIDADPRHVEEARRRLAPSLGQGRLELEAMDVFDFARRERGTRSWDVLVASAFLDLVDLSPTLPLLLDLLAPGGWFYFTLNFDGATILQPTLDATFDDQVEALYHETMDHRVCAGRPSGDSRCGRHLFHHLTRAGAEVLAAGSSDWVVFPTSQGYFHDEAYFLHFIVHTMEKALQGHPALDPKRFARWIARRHEQVEAGSLVYIAHQLDLVGRGVGGRGGKGSG